MKCVEVATCGKVPRSPWYHTSLCRVPWVSQMSLRSCPLHVAVVLTATLLMSASEHTDSDLPGFVLGIDLGTTFTCAAVWRKSGGMRVEVIPNGRPGKTSLRPQARRLETPHTNSKTTASICVVYLSLSSSNRLWVLDSAEQGNRITPSYVAWDDLGHMLVGDAAKNQATLCPERTVYDMKRLLGRK
jgi:hypothetical protein